MLTIRKSHERGLANHIWLKSYHTFSFADYYDPKHMGFHALRVINQDCIQAAQGFDPHPHENMEIISYVIQGALEHKDSLGNKAIICPGEVQRMSAGSGVIHSEYNALADQETHFFQIWIKPNIIGGASDYGQKSFKAELNSKKIVLVISSNGRDGSIPIRQDAEIYISRLKKDDDLKFNLRPKRGVWVQLIKGTILVNDKILNAGDAISAEEESTIDLKAKEDAEFILFDLA